MVSQQVATDVAEVFKSYHPFMRQYSSYINNFDYALIRLNAWSEKGGTGTVLVGASSGHSDTNAGMVAGSVSAGLAIASNQSGVPGRYVSVGMNPVQKKRVRAFLKHCRKHPRHEQINLESYLLLPIQRIPRYRMLLDDLARSTPPTHGISGDPIEDALQEIVALASSMNEEKRESESRRKLVKWQQRIRGKFSTPLVQAHRRLLLDGPLTITRIVKRSGTLAEVPACYISDDVQDQTLTNAKGIVQVETLVTDAMERPILTLLSTDMMLLCKDLTAGRDPDGAVDLFAVLKLQTKRNPARLLGDTNFRLVDNRVSLIFSWACVSPEHRADSGLARCFFCPFFFAQAVLYFSAPTHREAVNWVRIINNEFDPTR